jgi:hypothetical protein
MAVSKRTIEKWRSEALVDDEYWKVPRDGNRPRISHKLLNERVLKLTQEALDQHLIRKG